MTPEPLAGRVSATHGEPDPWRNRIPIADRGGPGYAELIASTRAYLDALAAAGPVAMHEAGADSADGRQPPSFRVKRLRQPCHPWA